MDEKKRRLEAIRRVAQGELVPDVCADLNRSRPWYYKWLKRFQEDGVSGLVDQRQGNTPDNATPDWLKKLIIETRDRLVKQAQNGASFQGIGAREVVRELEQLKVEVPHWTTVHRILKAAGRIDHAATPVGYCPRPPIDGLNSVHQIDLWPRVLEGGERLYFFHLVDVACWYPHGVERFHGECDQFFWSRRRFETVPQVREAYPDFLDYFRTQRQLPAIQGHTPEEMRTSWPDISPQRLQPTFCLHQQERLPIVAGIIHCVRLADNQGQVNVLNRHITLGSDYARHYILAQIDTAKQQVALYHQKDAKAETEQVKSCPFILKEEVHPFDPTFDYPVAAK
jgi:transposase